MEKTIKIYYALFMVNEGSQLLVWKSEKPASGQNFWLGGSNILPCIFETPQAARAQLRKLKAECKNKNVSSIFRNAHFEVKKISFMGR